MKYFTVAIALLLALVAISESRVFIRVDTFTDVQQLSFLLDAYNGSPTGDARPYSALPNGWYSPYLGDSDNIAAIPPVFSFKSTPNCIGGQRDLVIGARTSSDDGVIEVASGTSGTGLDIAFADGMVGTVYIQYDGDDTSGSNTAFPGSTLNTSPGIGANPSVTTANGDGRTVDFTSGGFATDFVIIITADNPINYFLTALEAGGRANEFPINYVPNQRGVGNNVTYRIPFTDSRWSTAGFNWAAVAAFQVRATVIFEGGFPVPPDSRFYTISTNGYEVRGNVALQCGCTGPRTTQIANEPFSLFTGATGGTKIRSAVSDANGDFSWLGLTDGTFRACFDNLAQERCGASLTNGCIVFTLANNIDPALLEFTITRVSTLTPPANRIVQCGADTSESALGSATATLCDGTNRTVTSTSQSATTGTCTKTFTRTFTDQGQTVVQTVTIQDQQAPVLTNPASSVSRSCSDNAARTYAVWRAANGDATFTDCSSFTVTNNGTASGPGNCGSITVAFTATDVCGNTTTSIGTYTIEDIVAPTFTTGPSAGSAPCNRDGSDFAALTQYLNTNGGITVTDNCGLATPAVTNNYVANSLQRGCSEIAIITFTARDACGNVATRTGNFTISDNAGPVITRQASSTSVTCSGNVQTAYQTFLTNQGGATASDLCDTTLSFSNNAPAQAPVGCNSLTPVTFTVTDSCGRSSSTLANFTVVDSVAPAFTTDPQPLSTSCANGNNAVTTWLQDNGGARATDACNNGAVFTNNFVSGSGNCRNAPVVFTVCDTCGNCATRSTTYTIVDGQAPVFNPLPSNSSVQCTGDVQTAFQAWLSSAAGGSASDNCASSNEITILNNNNNAQIGTTCNSFRTVVFQARDVCGNTSPGSAATFTVLDNTPPVVDTFPENVVVECTASNAAAFTSFRNSRSGMVATDSCSTVTYTTEGSATIAQPTGSGVCSSSEQVSWIASDSCGNSVRATATFTISDRTQPTWTTDPQNRTAACGQSGIDAWVASNGGGTATDACSTVRYTNTFSGQLDGQCTQSAVVTFVAIDQCGLSRARTATYSVTDTAPPVFNPAAQSRTVPCNSDTPSLFTAYLNDNGGARATDACQDSSTLQFSNDLPSAPTGCGSVTITFSVSDACNNIARTTSVFTATDNSAPTFSTPAQDGSFECDGSGNTNAYANYISTRAGAQATDSCAINLMYNVEAPATGPTTCRSQSVTVTAADSCGNVARSTATYTVRDTQPPQITTLPQDLTVECDGQDNASARQNFISTSAGAAASDVCAGAVQFVSRVANTTGGSCLRTTTYEFTVADTCGNSAVVTARFAVRDSTAPTFSVDPTNTSFECDGTGNAAQIRSYLNSNGGARAADVCQSSVNITSDFTASTLFGCTTAVVAFTASDSCGNFATRTASIEIVDSLDPVFSFFPEDKDVPCDADISTDVLGYAVARDQCSGDLVVNMAETRVQEPANGDCPGDIIITRVFSTVDECGNSLSREQVVTVLGQRGSGPCPPEGCECDGCCPPPAASDCIAVDCQASACSSAPCTAVPCQCTSAKSLTHAVARDVEDIPQCKPVYIYVNDDDDDNKDALAQQRMFVSNKPLHL
jgi:large repetitive protein